MFPVVIRESGFNTPTACLCETDSSVPPVPERVDDMIEAPDGAVLVLVDATNGERLRLSPPATRPAAAPVRRK